MRPVIVTTSGVQRSPVAVVDYLTDPVNISLAAIASGTVTYNVEYTYDDVFSATFNPATANWFVHATFSAATGTKDGNIAFPVRGISVNQTAGTGGISLTVLEAGIGGL